MFNSKKFENIQSHLDITHNYNHTNNHMMKNENNNIHFTPYQDQNNDIKIVNNNVDYTLPN